jgi:hypothetical protein
MARKWPFSSGLPSGPRLLRWAAAAGPVVSAGPAARLGLKKPRLLKWIAHRSLAIPVFPAVFADFLRWPDREVVTLVELTPSLTLANFTTIPGGGFPNTYQLVLPRKVLTSDFKGGIYRRCVGVRENATSLTEKTSRALVDANAGSWYWDEAAELLYVHSTTGSNPDTFTAYQAFVTFYFASKGIALNRVDNDSTTGIYYHPWLSPHGSQNISLMVEDMVSGSKANLTGDVSLLNGHGFWNTIIATDGSYNWKNKNVRFFVGGSYNNRTLLRSQYQALLTMQVNDVAADEDLCTMQLKPLVGATEIELPKTPYFETSYPNLGDGVRGQKKRIGYGRAIIAPDLTDTTVSQGRYTIADAVYQTSVRGAPGLGREQID